MSASSLAILNTVACHVHTTKHRGTKTYRRSPRPPWWQARLATTLDELEEMKARAAQSGEQDSDTSAMDGMEAALMRVTEILRRKEGELVAVKRTVNAECAERVRLLALLQQLQPEGAPAHDMTG